MLFKIVPENTDIKFTNMRVYAFVLSAVLLIGSLGLFFTKGLNFGIDFEGGTMLEIQTEDDIDIQNLRGLLGDLNLGDIQVQEFGAPNDVLIRIERQPGDAAAQQQMVANVRGVLEAELGEVDYRRVEFVGPQVSEELAMDATYAVGGALIAMLIYIWFRFEWQFSMGSVAALMHDVILTIGFFSLTGLEFNLSTIAAILTIVGYSMNDTVVVYDRVRENLRKFKKMEIIDVLDKSINNTLSRTAMTSLTTLLALGALYLFGGEVIRGFTAAMIFGVIVGTYSSVFIASPLLLALNVQRDSDDEETDKKKSDEIQEGYIS